MGMVNQHEEKKEETPITEIKTPEPVLDQAGNPVPETSTEVTPETK